MIFLKKLYEFFIKICRFIFGNISWTPPLWLSPLLKRLCLIKRFFVNNTKTAIASLIALLLTATLTIGGWLWYQNQPLPDMVSYDIIVPKISDYRQKPIQIYPLAIEFSQSVAPIDKVNQSISQGITISPALKGTWHWANDKILTFTPQEDWPIDRKMTVNLASKGLLNHRILLNKYQFNFTTQPFSISLERGQLYEDPQDLNDKKMVITLKASHPLEQKTLLAHASFALSRNLTYKNTKNTAAQVFFSDDGLSATFHSALLAMPLEAQTISFKLAKNIKSRLGGNVITQDFTQTLNVPGRYQLSFESGKINFITNEKDETEAVFIFKSSKPVADNQIANQVTAWQLPMRQASDGTRELWREHEITEDLLARAQKLPLSHIASDKPQNNLHAFKIDTTPNEQIYVRINGNIQSQGGYLSRQARVLYNSTMPNYPKTLKFMSQGALVGLRGERTLGIMEQGVKGVEIEIARLLPKQLHHLVSSLDDKFLQPTISESVFDRLVERQKTDFDLPDIGPKKLEYSYIDLSPFLSNEEGRRGIFVLRMSEKGFSNGSTLGPTRSDSDVRFLIVSDLAIIAKQDRLGGHDVFVQSIATGLPVDNALVEVYGVNGLPLMQGYSDSNGRTHFDNLNQLSREKRPLMYVVSNGEDQSFLPIHNNGRRLDLSRFAIDGLENSGDNNRLRAFIFSERGLYRPGETVHLGMIVRSDNWRSQLEGLPVTLNIYDPTNRNVATKNINLSANGFESYDFVLTVG